MFEGHSAAVNAVRFAPDGSFAVSGSADGSARLHGRDGALLGEVFLQTGGVSDLDVAPDGRRLAALSDTGELTVWSVDGLRPLATRGVHGAAGTRVRYRPDGAAIFTGGADGAVRAWSTDTWELLADVGLHAGAITGLDVSHDGMRLTSASDDGALCLWNGSTFAHVVTFEDRGGIRHLRTDSNGVVSTLGEGRVTHYTMGESGRHYSAFREAVERARPWVGERFEELGDPLLVAAAVQEAEDVPGGVRAALHLVALQSATPVTRDKPTVEALDPTWRLAREIDVAPLGPWACAHDPTSGALYFVSEDSRPQGLFRLAEDGSWELLDGGPYKGVAVDDTNGDVYYTEDWRGVLYRWRGDGPPETWVESFADEDTDPMGIAIAPPDYAGPLLSPGDGLVGDHGFGGTPAVHRFSTSSPGSRGAVVEGGDAFREDVELYGAVAIDRTRAIVIDSRRPTLLELTDAGTLAELSTDRPIPRPQGCAFDPVTGEPYVVSSYYTLVRVDAEGRVHDVARGFEGLGIGGAIAFTADGARMYCADEGGERILVFERR